MSYRCELCTTLSPPGKPRLVHVVTRPSPEHAGEEVAHEIAVCARCHREIQYGADPKDLVRTPPPVVPAGRPDPTAPRRLAPPSSSLKRAGDGLAEATCSPRCDLCGAPVVGDGQVTGETNLCGGCLTKHKET